MFATGVTMGLAKWIIDDTCLVFYLSVKSYLKVCIETEFFPGFSQVL